MRGGRDCLAPKTSAELTQPLRFTASFPWSPRQNAKRKPYGCTAVFVFFEYCFVQARQYSKKQKPLFRVAFCFALCARDSGGIRTHDPQLRRLLLYPTELRNHPYMHSSQMLRKSNIFFPITLHLIDNFSHKVEYSAIWAVIHLPHSQAIHPLGNHFIE